ncbi:MAG: helix-turn-helix transcriptional regulator [Clostridia bacterium]|nr:helix-turn-helix transcriptional regulator [Clostridia bacterium]
MPHKSISPDDLYRYVSSIARKKKIKFDELAIRMQMSKTTLWRYMKGMNSFTPEYEQRICDALEIDGTERDELHRLISINLVDSSLVAARYSIDRYLFGGTNAAPKPTQFDFVFYADKPRERKSSDVISEIINLTDKKDCVSEAYVINCCEGTSLENMTYLLGSLIPSGKSGKIEQLIVLPDKNYRKSITTLFSLMPLLRIKGYKAIYSRDASLEQLPAPLKNSVLIKLTYGPEDDRRERYYAITLNVNAVSYCIRFEDSMYFEFLKANYESYKKLYAEALPEKTDLHPFGQDIMDFEVSGDYALIKPDPIFSTMSVDALKSMASRMTDLETEAFAKSLGYIECDDAAKKIKDCLSAQKKRYKNTFEHSNIYVHSRMGLEEFARTGRARDPVVALPAFTRHEMRQILENYKMRMLDPGDPFKMYITYKDFLFGGQALSACKNSGIMMDIGITKRLKGMNHSLIINDAQIANTIVDYVTNHIPAYHALDADEAIDFIDSLINRYAQ